MAVDLSKLSLTLLKAELKQLGLETTGKKSALVERLKKALETKTAETEDDSQVQVKMETEEAPADTSTEQAASADTSTEQAEAAADSADEEKKVKRWLHIRLGSRLASSKHRQLEVVQQMSAGRRKKDIAAQLVKHQVRMFPITTADMTHPILEEAFKKCAGTTVTYISVKNEDGTSQFKGLLQLTFRKIGDAIASLETLKAFREGIHIYHPSLDVELAEYQKDWNRAYQGEPESPEHFLTLVPHLPDEITEDELWDLFPEAREIYMCPKRTAMSKVGGEEKMREQPPYAYIQFPDVPSSLKNVAFLNAMEPTEEMKKMCLVPFNKQNWGEQRGRTENGTNSGASTSANKNASGFRDTQNKKSAFVARQQAFASGYPARRGGYGSMQGPPMPRSMQNRPQSAYASLGMSGRAGLGRGGMGHSSEAAAMLAGFGGRRQGLYPSKRALPPGVAASMMAGKRMRMSNFDLGYDEGFDQYGGYDEGYGLEDQGYGNELGYDQGYELGYEQGYADDPYGAGDIPRLENLRLDTPRMGGNSGRGHYGRQGNAPTQKRGKSHYVPRTK